MDLCNYAFVSQFSRSINAQLLNFDTVFASTGSPSGKDPQLLLFKNSFASAETFVIIVLNLMQMFYNDTNNNFASMIMQKPLAGRCDSTFFI
jgi:hypothetical protein